MSSEVVDLRSDTLTHPTPQMREAMAAAEVGDDQYGEDPTVNRLEATVAELLGKEAAIYMPSGIMGNLTSILAQTTPGSEIIMGDLAHIFWHESAGAAGVGGVATRLLPNNPDGTFSIDALRGAIRSNSIGNPPTSLICVEQTHNRCSGAVLPKSFLQDVRTVADDHGLPVHMDGARIWNAAAALGVEPAEIAAYADTVQCALSKGLAAPVGSMVAGSAEVVQRVRAKRKMLGGAMRQSGVIAAAGIVALDTMRARLPEDHARARRLAEAIAGIDGLAINLDVIHSNIVVFKPRSGQSQLIAALKERDILVSDFSPIGIRMVTHYEITDDGIDRVIEVLREITPAILADAAS